MNKCPSSANGFCHLFIGIDCPRGARTTKEGSNGVTLPGDAYAQEALAFSKEYCMHREVSDKLTKNIYPVN